MHKPLLQVVTIAILSLATTHVWGQESSTTPLAGRRYLLQHDVRVRTYTREHQPAFDITLTAQEEMEVLAIENDPILGPMLRLGLDVDPDQNFASDLLVNASEFQNGLPRELTLIEILLSKGMDGAMTYCYRDVKLTLLKMGICTEYPSGSMAWQGYEILQEECGMKPAKFSKKLPLGAVCVSSGGRSCGDVKCGHIAVKVEKRSWFGAGYRDSPWIAGRDPMGCLVPGDHKLSSL